MKQQILLFLLVLLPFLANSQKKKFVYLEESKNYLDTTEQSLSAIKFIIDTSKNPSVRQQSLNLDSFYSAHKNLLNKYNFINNTSDRLMQSEEKCSSFYNEVLNFHNSFNSWKKIIHEGVIDISIENLFKDIKDFPEDILRQASCNYEIGDFFREKKLSLYSVASILTNALKNAGFEPRISRQSGATNNSFIIETDFQQYNQDGSCFSDPTIRHNLITIEFWRSDLSFKDKAKILLLGKATGYYRMFVFHIYPEKTSSKNQTDIDTTVIKSIGDITHKYSPSIALDNIYQNKIFDKNYLCKAMVFEFEKEASNSEEIFRIPGMSRKQARQHLEASKIWSNILLKLKP